MGDGGYNDAIVCRTVELHSLLDDSFTASAMSPVQCTAATVLVHSPISYPRITCKIIGRSLEYKITTPIVGT